LAFLRIEMTIGVIKNPIEKAVKAAKRKYIVG
jgi:hypothetical protein